MKLELKIDMNFIIL